ncbi:hypothetical protein D3C86_1518390 [compost metagenome]
MAKTDHVPFGFIPLGGSYVVEDGQRFDVLDIDAALSIRPAFLSINLRPVDFKVKQSQEKEPPAQAIVPGSMKLSIATISQDADDGIELRVLTPRRRGHRT